MIYVASSSLTDARRMRDALVSAGMWCSSSWIDDPLFNKRPPSDFARAAAQDLADVRASRGLVVVLPRDRARGGLWIEMGAALAHGLPVVAVEPESMMGRPGSDGRRNIFVSLVPVVATYREAAEMMHVLCAA